MIIEVEATVVAQAQVVHIHQEEVKVAVVTVDRAVDPALQAAIAVAEAQAAVEATQVEEVVVDQEVVEAIPVADQEAAAVEAIPVEEVVAVAAEAAVQALAVAEDKK